MWSIKQAFEGLLVLGVKVSMEKAHAQGLLVRPAGREARRCALSWLAGLGWLALDREGKTKDKLAGGRNTTKDANTSLLKERLFLMPS